MGGKQSGQKEDDKISLIFIIGAPYSGKKTQMIKLCQGFNYFTIESVLKQFKEKTQKNEVEVLIKKINTESILYYSKEDIELIKEAIKTIHPGKIIINGFPSNEQNMKEWDTIIKDNKKSLIDLKCVINLNITNEEMVRRKFGDDNNEIEKNKESFISSIKKYNESMGQVVVKYRKEKLLILINGQGTKDEVYKRIEDQINKKNINI